MSAPDESRNKDAGQKIIARAMKERRRFRRVHVAITGRLYIPATQEESICTVEDISPGDASLLCKLKEEPKGRAVIYLETLGRFEGPIVRAKNGSFVMTFTCSLQKREKLADQLTLELNRELLGDDELRGFDRSDATPGSFMYFTRWTGEQIRCEVLDLSVSGVSVRTETKPPLGEHILIGHRAGRVTRHHGEGVGIEFLGVSPTAHATEPPSTPAVARPLKAVSSCGATPTQVALAARR